MTDTQKTLQSRFQQTTFLISGNALSHLPQEHGREVAFAGRSNAGKSSALNLITSQHQLARTSKTPGRTQLINYFTVDHTNFLVDLPGYGYAKVPEAIRLHWQKILQAYFEQRQQLVGLIILMDVRHPLTPLDCQMLDWCHSRQLPVHILLTKADKLKRGLQQATLLKVRRFIQTHYRDGLVTVQLFSATNREGLMEVWQCLAVWLPTESIE